VIAVLIDHHLEGYATSLQSAWLAGGWNELVSLQFTTLVQVGLEVDCDDRTIWRFVQARGMLLLTANRNMKGADSLEQTIREENTLSAHPVITIGNEKRLDEPDYRTRCAARLAEIVFDLEDYLGVGRVYIP
jgi:hypothetical protein